MEKLGNAVKREEPQSWLSVIVAFCATGVPVKLAGLGGSKHPMDA
jgi:hypothetical protein